MRIDEDVAHAGLGLRATGSLEEGGFNAYIFDIEPQPVTKSHRFCIRAVDPQRIVGSKCVSSDLPVGEDFFIEATAMGNDLSLKIWDVDDPEPAVAQVTWTDTRYDSGRLGVFAQKDGSDPRCIHV